MNRLPIAGIAIQAPAMNLVTRTMSRTVPVAMNPMVLMTRRAGHPAALGRIVLGASRVQCRTMPIWLSVNEMNTPTM